LLQILHKAGWPVHTDRLLPEEVVAEIEQVRKCPEVSV
jgi:hypothetical protein